MKPLEKLPLAQQVETMLEEAILGGFFGRELPGYRELGKILGVSRTAISPALAALVDRGILISPGPRRRFQIADSPAKTKASQELGKILLLEVNMLGERSAVSDSFATELNRLIEPDGWKVEHLVIQADQSRAAPSRWQRLMKGVSPNALIVIAGHRPLLEWACVSGVPALALGGDVGDLPLPLVTHDASQMIEEAINQLFLTGHRDICLPIGVRTPGFMEKTENTITGCFRKHQVPFIPRLHFPKWHANTPDAWEEGLEWRFTTRRPDALVLLGNRPFHTVQGVIMRRGWSVPKDLSIVVISDQSELRWFRPKPACFAFDTEMLARSVAKWLKNPASHKRFPTAKARWMEGGTIRDRRDLPG